MNDETRQALEKMVIDLAQISDSASVTVSMQQWYGLNAARYTLQAVLAK